MYTQETYERLCKSNPAQSKRYAGLARADARKAGRPAPAWAFADVPARTAAPNATQFERDFTAKCTTIVDEHAALRAPGRVLALSADGAVRFVEWHEGLRVEATFASMAEARAAVADGSIAWRARRAQRANREAIAKGLKTEIST